MKQSYALLQGAAALAQLYEEELALALTAVQRKDSEALHDLRVALRRLSVLVKQLARPDDQRRRLLRSIKDLLTDGNRGRDAQVTLTWLEGEWPRLDERERIGAREWQRKLERQLASHMFEPKQVASALKSLVRTLNALSPQDDRVQLPLGLLAAQRLELRTNELGSLMKGDGVADRLHFIRLKAKTVRYLLLRFCDESPGCVRALLELQRCQTQLGEWHDAVVRQQSLINLLRNKVVTILGDTKSGDSMGSVAEQSPALPGLLALVRSNTLEQQRLIALIERNYLHDGGTPLINLLQQAISELRKAATVHG